MRRSTLNLIIDVISFVVVAAMVATGLLIRFILPPGSRGGRGLSLWNFDRHDWGDFHFWLAVSMMGLLLVHLALHWSWVCQVARAAFLPPRSSPSAPVATRRTVLGMTLLTGCAAFIGAFLYFASANVNHARGGDFEADDTSRGRTVDRPANDERPHQGGQHRRGRRGSSEL